jgi:acyl-CoA reductase-like NAD-dependent aldehyde dehydrogenase
MTIEVRSPVTGDVLGTVAARDSGAGRHPAAVGRLVVAPGPAEPVLERLVAGALRLRVGDPEHADTQVAWRAARAALQRPNRSGSKGSSSIGDGSPQ